MNLRSINDWLKQLELQPPNEVNEVNIANIPIENAESTRTVNKGEEVLDHLPILLKLGWSINHIVNVSSDNTLDMLVALLLKRVNFSRNYHAYLLGFPASDIIPSLIVVPNVGAVQYFSLIPSSSNYKNAIYYKDRTEVETLLSYFKKLCQSASLLMESKNQSDAGWHALITDIESTPGERLQARELFTTLSEPFSLCRKYYQERGFPPSEVDDLLSMHAARVNALTEQIGYYRFLNIAERRSVEKYIATGEREREGTIASPKEVSQQVLTEVELLQNHPNYYLGLTDEEIPVALQIKADKVLIEVIKPISPADQIEQAAYINISSLALLEAFRRYYESMWRNIKPEFRQKASVIAWLKAQLDKRR